MSNENKKKYNFLIEALDFVRIILVCFVIVFVVTQFLFRPVVVEGKSMYPTLEDGEFGFSNIFSALNENFSRFDVVVVKADKTDQTNWVKRIIGMPEETIEYRNDQLYINGKQVKEPFLDKDYIASQKNYQGLFTEDFGPFTLGKDEFFVMGDNRGVSHDSRAVGAFKAKEIVSKSVLVLYPFDKMGLVSDGTK